jgi:hypothetical protein
MESFQFIFFFSSWLFSFAEVNKQRLGVELADVLTKGSATKMCHQQQVK